MNSSFGRARAIELMAGLEQPDLEQLARIVPLVERLRDVEPFVTLKADQLGAERRRQRLGDLGLADAGLAFEKQGPPQLQREVNRDRQTPIGDIELPARSCSSWSIDAGAIGQMHATRRLDCEGTTA